MALMKTFKLLISLFLAVSLLIIMIRFENTGTVGLIRFVRCGDWENIKESHIPPDEVKQMKDLCGNGYSFKETHPGVINQIPRQHNSSQMEIDSGQRFNESVQEEVEEMFENSFEVIKTFLNHQNEKYGSSINQLDAVIENEEELDYENSDETEEELYMQADVKTDRDKKHEDLYNDNSKSTIDEPGYLHSETQKSYDTIKTKKVHFAFLKVHKAGSTTMQNIFFRFGLRYNLTFVLPYKGHYLRRSERVLPVEPNTKHDILSCHIYRYKAHFFKRFLPEDSVNIAIIRQPLDRMISAAYYYRDVLKKIYLKKVPKDNFILNLIQHPELYDKEPFSRTRNSMGRDFGFFQSVTEDDTEQISATLKQLVKECEIVLVMERFDESLVLLRRFMNWDILDIIYLSTNRHEHEPIKLRPKYEAKFRSTNFLDYAIFDTFSQIFDAKIRDFNSAQKIKDVPPEPLNNTMVYCCQGLGNDSIICGGHNHNMARFIDRGTLNTTGQLLDLQQSVYCLDNNHKGVHPKVAIGSQNFIYFVKEEKKAS